MSPRRDTGASAVEFALVLPLVLGLVGLALTAGLAFSVNAMVARSAEVAARAAAVPVDGVYRSDVTDAAREGALLIAPTVDSLLCDPCGEGGQVTVQVSYEWDNPAAGLLSVASGGRFGDTFTFTSQAQRVIE